MVEAILDKDGWRDEDDPLYGPMVTTHVTHLKVHVRKQCFTALCLRHETRNR